MKAGPVKIQEKPRPSVQWTSSMRMFPTTWLEAYLLPNEPQRGYIVMRPWNGDLVKPCLDSKSTENERQGWENGQQVKVLDAKSENLRSIPETHKVEGENWLPELCPLTFTHMPWHASTHTHTYIHTLKCNKSWGAVRWLSGKVIVTKYDDELSLILRIYIVERKNLFL